MKKVIFFLGLTNMLLYSSAGFDADHYLAGRLSIHDKRHATFKKALQLMKEREVKVIVETGTARGGTTNFVGDGGSSILFSHYAQENNAHFYSVDIDPQALKNASQAVEQSLDKKSPTLHFVEGDSIQFLRNFSEKIDFLYLDSYDFDFNNPAPSQLHHLAEIKEAYPKLTSTALVMIDDCDLPEGGKGQLVIDYLLKKDWVVIQQGYQVILAHP